MDEKSYLQIPISQQEFSVSALEMEQFYTNRNEISSFNGQNHHQIYYTPYPNPPTPDHLLNMYQNGDGIPFEMDCDGQDVKHLTTARQRRRFCNEKFLALMKLVPNPTKCDRASIIGDAIEYINELKGTVTELKVLVEKKRCAKERLMRPKTEDAILEGNESKPLDDLDNSYNGSSLRSSWLHRKSKDTVVDVRIIDDQVTVKLVQQKGINCLLFVSKVLDDLHLDLHHVAGGLIGDYYSYLFNSKMCEGSIVYASAVANKLIEVVDKHYAAIPPRSCN